MTEAISRLCTECGRHTPDLICAQDDSATVIVRRYDPNAVLQPGMVVAERYRLLGVLGRGGYGSVYAAEQVTTGQEVALKVLKHDFDGPDDGTVRRFFREARVTAALMHPNTIRVFDVGQTEAGAFYIAMERLKGPTLEEVLHDRFAESKVLSEVEVIDIAVPVLRSLQEAHGRKLVHRDMKPANIVLANYGGGETLVKLLDFGIALTAGSSLTTSGMALGTPAYMSPEQCEAITIDGRSDLYSLGIILYRCVTGDVPFSDRNPVAIMQSHLMSPVPDVRGRAGTPLSDALVAVINRALAKECADRYADASEMRIALESARKAGFARVPSTLDSLVHGHRHVSALLPADLPEAPPPAVYSDTAIAPAAARKTRKPHAAAPSTRKPLARRTLVLAALPATMAPESTLAAETTAVPATTPAPTRPPAMPSRPTGPSTSPQPVPSLLAEDTTERLLPVLIRRAPPKA